MGFVSFESYSARLLMDSDTFTPAAALHSMKCMLYSLSRENTTKLLVEINLSKTIRQCCWGHNELLLWPDLPLPESGLHDLQNHFCFQATS